MGYQIPIPIAFELAAVRKALAGAGVDLRTVRVVINPSLLEQLKRQVGGVDYYVRPGEPPPLEQQKDQLQLREDPLEPSWRVEQVT